MKQQVKYSVELQSFPSFQFFEGAKEFMEKYKRYESEYSYYIFDLNDEVHTTVKNDLSKYGLKYRIYYELFLPISEYQTYPCFNLIIPVLYELSNGKSVNEKVIKKIPIAEDIDSGVVVFIGNFYEALKEIIKNIDYIKNIVGKKHNYYAFENCPEMISPRVIIGANDVKENAEKKGTYYLSNWDGRSLIEEEGLDFLRTHHLVCSRYFQVDDKIYEQNAMNFLVSGILAQSLKNTFGDQIQLTPITFDNIKV